MPVEIRELHIRVTVNAPAGGGNAPTQAAAAPTPTGGGSSADKEAIVAECVEQVMQLLQDKRER